MAKLRALEAGLNCDAKHPVRPAQARIAESGQQQPANSAWAFAATAAVEHPLTSNSVLLD